MKTNKQTIEALYGAFSVGNVPFILENVADNFTWIDPCDPAIVPHGGKHVGKAGFLNFFQQLGGNVDTTLFEVGSYVSEGDTVVAMGKHGITVRATGKSNLIEWAMVWQFENGVPVGGQSYYDTAGVATAFQN